MTEDSITVPAEIAQAYRDYETARSARSRWAEEEKNLKAKITTFLGYEDDDPKPVPVTAVTPSGIGLFRVSVGTWRGLDTTYLKTNFPDVYASCERTKPTKAIKAV